ncbi:MAG: HAMP domain-containing protein [Clostridia bacterium]|nr:HAMP domain-containing protein [Clostridia bacterium]
MGIQEKIQKKANRRQQVGRSIYFILWAIFSVFSLVILLLIGGTQLLVAEQSFRYEMLKSVSSKGNAVKEALCAELPSAFQGDQNAYVRFLSDKHNAVVFVLSNSGELLSPKEEVDLPEWGNEEDFVKRVNRLKEQLKDSEREFTVYVEGGEYVYGTKLSDLDGGRYLYVSESTLLVESVMARTSRRVWVVALFLFVLSFALSSAIAGWLTKPLSVMTAKARRLAEGDFSVDFKGSTLGEIEELAETLNFARDEIFKADKMQKELIANVSHDFKTPLTMIKAYASMIMEISGDDPARRAKHAQVIIDETDRLNSLVSDVLDLSKIRAGINELKLTEVDVSSYLNEVMEKFKYLEESGYQFETHIEKDLITLADELKIGQVLYNLIGNAVNYTGEDKKVLVSLCGQDENTFRFSVTDTGNGLTEEEKSVIWERYYRSSEMHKRPVKGTGLGLSIVKTVLEKHHYEFGVESEKGKGSTFFVVFPKAETVLKNKQK